MNLNVLVVDDAILFRRVMTDVLQSLPNVTVVGSAANGKLALQRVIDLKPDLLTLDMEMPEMDGLAVLDGLQKTKNPPAVIVVSALTRKGGQLTLSALQKGAFDFITKPESLSAEKSREMIRSELAPRIRALANRLEVRTILGTRPARPPEKPAITQPVSKSATDTLAGIAGRMNRLTTQRKPELLLIGVSTGGPNALNTILPRIPKDIGVPILIVQHMPPIFTQSLAESLAAKCAVDVKEAAHGETVLPNTVYIAPGGRHMRLGPGPESSRLIHITDDPPENNCKPAVDYLFRSVATHFPGQGMAVILTGMGNDGTMGLRLLKRHGCFVIAQDEDSCVVYGMPKAAADAGMVDVVLPLDAIASRIVMAIREGKA